MTADAAIIRDLNMAAELHRNIEYRAWVLAPPRTPRAKRDDTRSEVLTTAAGLPADPPNRLRLKL